MNMNAPCPPVPPAKVGYGSDSDSPDSPAIGPLISEKQTKSARKRTWGLNVSCQGSSGRSTHGPKESAHSQHQTLALPKEVEHWSLTTLREKLIKIGAKVVRHGRYVAFQLAEVTISRTLFAKILRLIGQLRPAPLPP